MEIFGYKIEISKKRNKEERYAESQRKRKATLAKKRHNRVECPVCHNTYINLRSHFSAFAWEKHCARNGQRKDSTAIAHDKWIDENLYEYHRLCDTNTNYEERTKEIVLQNAKDS